MNGNRRGWYHVITSDSLGKDGHCYILPATLPTQTMNPSILPLNTQPNQPNPTQPNPTPTILRWLPLRSLPECWALPCPTIASLHIYPSRVQRSLSFANWVVISHIFYVHPNMLIFSRKNPWVCWVYTTILGIPSFLGGDFKYLVFSPLFGEDEPNLTIIFFKWVGSTTQLANLGALRQHMLGEK